MFWIQALSQLQLQQKLLLEFFTSCSKKVKLSEFCYRFCGACELNERVCAHPSTVSVWKSERERERKRRNVYFFIVGSMTAHKYTQSFPLSLSHLLTLSRTHTLAYPLLLTGISEALTLNKKALRPFLWKWFLSGPRNHHNFGGFFFIEKHLGCVGAELLPPRLRICSIIFSLSLLHTRSHTYTHTLSHTL